MKPFPLSPVQIAQISVFPGDIFFWKEMLLFNSNVDTRAERTLPNTVAEGRLTDGAGPNASKLYSFKKIDMKCVSVYIYMHHITTVLRGSPGYANTNQLHNHPSRSNLLLGLSTPWWHFRATPQILPEHSLRIAPQNPGPRPHLSQNPVWLSDTGDMSVRRAQVLPWLRPPVTSATRVRKSECRHSRTGSGPHDGGPGKTCRASRRL